VSRVTRVFRTTLALALAGAAVTGCAKQEEGARTLQFWTIGREGEAVEKLLPEFEREHPGLHVSVQQLPLTAAHQKLLTAYAGNSTPDITQLGNTWVPELVALDAIEPLDARVAGSKVVDRNDYFAAIWSTNVTACPGMSIRACCSIARISSPGSATTTRRVTGPSGRR